MFVTKSLWNGIAAFEGDRAERLTWPETVGRHRALQGLPAVAVQRAYHIGGQVLAGAITECGAEDGHPADIVTGLADRIWDIAAEHADTAVRSLRFVQNESRDQRTAGYLLDAVLNGESDAGFLATIGQAFALPLGGRYAVIAHRPANDGPPLRSDELPSWVDGIRVIWRTHGETALGVVVLGDEPADAVRAWFRVRPGRRTAISIVVDRLADLGRARQLADLGCRMLAHECKPAFLEERLAAGLLGLNPDLAQRLSRRVLGPVLELEESGRRMLLDTLTEWLAADGNAARAAVALNCHRNTVLYRLRRLEQLTGRSVTSPRNMVELALALEATQVTAAS